MRRAFPLHLALAAAATVIYACTAGTQSGTSTGGGGGAGTGGASSTVTASSSSGSAGGDDAGEITFDAQSEDPALTEDAACAAVSQEAVAVALPVDIIWVVDNSASMASSIDEVQAGLGAF